MDRLRDKIAMITGAASGIGAATALRFAQEGAALVLADLNVSKLDEQFDQLLEFGARVHAVALDVRDEVQWARALEEVKVTFGTIDVLMNNAGIAIPGNIEEMTFEDWNAELSVNLNGVFLGTKHGFRSMRETGGSIINMSSIEGMVGIAEYVAYSAGKAGVRNLTKAAALHAGKRGYPIRVNSIHPGYIKTPMVGNDATLLAELVKKHPIGFLGEAVDVANMALFLASDEARFCTGAEYIVDGGFLAQ
ncbi:SDR family NAD(P)-dependent oxidoreductase [Burkholderia sp. BE12]|uniref:SDR family NAD(P)-dependent oxidoreductase n=1 Tax=Burkholderia sp. BE12 TaxID=2082394 RepID=UPI000CF4F6DE|nr:SDR family oxidoreductase [Burkholderia sp. BE12]